MAGLATLQLKTTARATQASQFYLADNFMGSLLTEISTTNYNWYSGANLKKDAPFFKAKQASFPAASSSSCNPDTNNASELAKAFLGCWSSQITKTMDVDETLLKNHYFICQSKDGKSCSSEGTLVLVQMAWYSKDCKSLSSNAYNDINSCAEDATAGIRLYRVAIQP